MTVRSAWLLNASTATPAQSRQDTRLAPLGTMVPSATDALTSRSGLIPGPNPCNLTMSGMTATIGLGRGVVQGTSSQGAYPLAVTAADATTIANGHATLDRIDTLWLIALDTLVDSSGSTLSRIEYTQGTPSATPTAPTAPAAGAAYLRLWDIKVPAGASAGTPPNWTGLGLLTDRRTYTSAVGGINPDGATTGAYAGQYRDGGTTTGLERYTGSAWESRVYLGTSGQLVIGTDVNLKRGGTNQLATDDDFLIGGNLAGASNVNTGAWATYTPTWTSTGTAPTAGNGTFAGRYQRVGRAINLQMYILFGSTSNAGSGEWRFSLPVAAASIGSGTRSWHGSAVGTNPATAYWPGVAIVEGGTSVLSIVSSTSAAGSTSARWGATVPYTWTSNHYLSLSITYEAAS